MKSTFSFVWHCLLISFFCSVKWSALQTFTCDACVASLVPCAVDSPRRGVKGSRASTLQVQSMLIIFLGCHSECLPNRTSKFASLIATALQVQLPFPLTIHKCSALDSHVVTHSLMGFGQGQTADVTHALTASLSAEMRCQFPQSFCASGL